MEENKFRADIEQYMVSEPRPLLQMLLTKEGLWALAEYRFNNWVDREVHIPLIEQILIVFGTIWHKLITILTGIELPKRADIGGGLYIVHSGCIIIHPDVKMGKNCTLSHDVTIGLGGRGEKLGCPKIGDRVYIAPGARIFGAISIGNDVAIGANAVVTKDLPDNAVAVGIPAKIISYKGSQDFIFRPKE
jgi:serine O-acetyltransferase